MKFLLKPLLCLAGAGLMGLAAGTQAATPSPIVQSSATASALPASQWVLGYYVAYHRSLYPPEKIDWSGLTHIVMGRIKAQSDGTLDTQFDWDAVNGPALARDIAVRAHAAGKKAILMLGGDDNGPAIRDAVTNNRAKFVANLVATLKAYGYDGLDLDWEDHIDWDLFLAFVKDLRQAAPNLVLTLPTAALNTNYMSVEPRLPALAPYLDRINLMTYYPATAWAGDGWWSWHNSPLKGGKPHTPVSIESSLQLYAAAGIPKQKLGMGISFYAICYTGGITKPNQVTDGASIRGGDNEFMLSELFSTNGAYSEAARRWDAKALQPYLSLSKPERHGCRYVSFEDEQSIVEKGRFSRQNGYGGIIIWTINEGFVQTHSEPNFLMQALRRGFLEPDAPQRVGLSIMQGNSWLKTSASLRLGALVTGTANKAVTWAVAEPDCGSVDATGLYAAPAAEKSCSVTATSQADPSKTASVSLTVSNASWTPSFKVTRPGQWWVEVKAMDPAVASMSVQWADGTWSPLSRFWTDASTGRTTFAANDLFPDAGGTFVFQARSADNRSTKLKLKVPGCVHGSDGVCH
jgi:chitinase